MIAVDRRFMSRAAAVALLIVALWLLVSVTFVPIWMAFSDRLDEIDRLSELIGRLRHTAAEAASLQTELARLVEDRRGGSALLKAPNANQAGTLLQAEVRRIAETGGAQIQAIQQMPARQEEHVARVGVTMTIQADTAQISHILYDLESHSPTLIVRSLSIRGSEQPAAQSGVKALPLNAQIEVNAFTAGAP